MPCYQVQRMSVKLAAANRELLMTALSQIEGVTQIRKVSEQNILFVYGGQTASIYADAIDIPKQHAHLIDKIKIGYSREVIKTAASRFKWNVQEKSTTQFVAKRRF